MPEYKPSFNRYKKKKTQKALYSFVISIINLPQSFLIWWTGAKLRDLPKHLRKPYAGLGGMAMVSTVLATLGGYSFVLISIGSITGAIAGAVLAGYFMWGMDRSILSSTKNNSSVLKKKSSSPKGVWVKLAINVAFSSILTLPLSVYIQKGAVQKHNMGLIAADIEKVDSKIGQQNQRVAALQKKKEEIDANWRFGGRVDGSRNESYFQDKEDARKAVIQAKNEKSVLVDEKKRLKNEYAAYERGDLRKVSLSFPEQFYYMLSQARWTDNLLNLAFFTITALMGAGAVLIKTFVLGTDSYSKKLQTLEEAANRQQDLQNALDTSAQQIYHSLFNTDVMSDRMRIKLERLQQEFELKTESMATWLYDERAKQMQLQVNNQAIAEGIDLNNFDSSHLGYSQSTDVPKSSKSSSGYDVAYPREQNFNYYEESSASNGLNDSSATNIPNSVPSEDRNSSRTAEIPLQNFANSHSNTQLVDESTETATDYTDEDFMDLFAEIDRQIDSQTN